MSEDIDKRVAQFVAIRDKRRLIKEQFDAADKPLRELQDILSGRLHAFMDASNVKNLKTAHGTCYVSTRYTASLADPEVFMQFVIANRLFSLIDRRANAAAVKDYVSEHNVLPPGCNLSGIQTVGVRRGNEKE